MGRRSRRATEQDLAAMARLGSLVARGEPIERLLPEAVELLATAIAQSIALGWELSDEGTALLRASAGQGVEAAVPHGTAGAAARIETLLALPPRDRGESAGVPVLEPVPARLAGWPGAAIVLPHDGRPAALLGLYRRPPKPVRKRHLRLLASVAALLAASSPRPLASTDPPSPHPSPPGDALAALASREDLITILEAVADGITAQDPTGRLVYANQAAVAALGAGSREALLATPTARLLEPFDLFDDEGRPFPVEQLPGRLALRGNADPAAVVCFRRKDNGEERWAMVRATPVFDAAGAVRLAINAFHDVTRAKQAEQFQQFLAEAGRLLAGSLDPEATLATVAELAVPRLADWCVVHLVDEADEIAQAAVAHADPAKIAWARALQDRYPPDPSDDRGVRGVIRRGAPELYPVITADLLAAVARDEEHLRLLREVGFTSAMIVPLIARGRTLGAITFVTAESARHYGHDDLELAENLAARCAIAVDNARLYTMAREAERRIREQARRTAVLADASRAFAAASLDAQRVLEEAVRITGELIGDVAMVRLLADQDRRLTLGPIYHPEPGGAEFVRSLAGGVVHDAEQGFNGRVIRTGQTLLIPALSPDEFSAGTLPEYRAYAERFGTHSLLVVPLRVRDRLIGTLGLSRTRPGRPYTLEDQILLEDLADRACLAVATAELYAEAQDAIRARDEFLSIAAHELRTPVAGLKGYAQMLLRARARGSALADDRLDQALGRIDVAADRLSGLTNDLLDVSRIRLGQLPLRRQPLDLVELLQEIGTRVVEPHAATHRLQIEVIDAPARAHLDPDRIAQVVTNLLDNAIKYAPEGGAIIASVAPQDDGLRLSVRDPGIGLPPHATETIFEPFSRAPNAMERRLPGLGLGLYICRNIVERHGGRIWAESAGDGTGSTFNVWLPLAPAAIDPAGDHALA